MPRRVSLPGAAELFRATRPEPDDDLDPGLPHATTDTIDARARLADAPTGDADDPAPDSDEAAALRSTGRVRHDEKITVYVSTDELIALEQTRLRLRADHDTAVDRGRIVREAVSMALEDFAVQGADSPLVRRLTRS